MNSHLVTVKVSVVSGTDTGVQLNCCSFNQDRIESLDTEFVQGWSTVKQYRMIFGNFLKNIKDFRRTLLNIAFCRFNIGCKTSDNNFTKDERFEHLKRHFFWQSTLVKPQFRTNYDNRTTRIINTFSKKVLSEAALLTSQHVRKRSESR